MPIPSDLNRRETDLFVIRKAFARDRKLLQVQSEKDRKKDLKKRQRAAQATPTQSAPQWGRDSAGNSLGSSPRTPTQHSDLMVNWITPLTLI